MLNLHGGSFSLVHLFTSPLKRIVRRSGHVAGLFFGDEILNCMFFISPKAEEYHELNTERNSDNQGKWEIFVTLK